MEPFCTPCEPGSADEREAARLEIEHRLPLGLPHQRFGAAARGEANLDAAGRVSRREERLRPRRVVSVDEHGLGAVDGQRLGIGHEALDRKPEVQALLDGALGEDPRPARSGSRRESRARSAGRSGRRRRSSPPRRSRGPRPRRRPRRAAPGSPSGSSRGPGSPGVRRARSFFSANISSTGSSIPAIRASRAGVRPRERETRSARGVSTSTRRRPISRSSSAAASSAAAGSMPHRATKWSIMSHSSGRRPSSSTTAPSLELERRLRVVRRRSRRRGRVPRRARSAPRAGARARHELA